MPYANVPDSLQDKMDSCVQQVMDKDGLEKDAAIAICYTSVVEGKSVPLNLDSVKVGRRNSQADAARILKMRELAAEILAMAEELEPGDMQEDESEPEEESPDMEKMVVIGEPVKAMPGGKVCGYLVRFSTTADPDVTGEYFTKDTDFGEHTQTPILYHHAADGAIKSRKLGTGTLTKDDVGVWVEAQLNMRDDYERVIYEMAQAGVLGWSSGTAGHLVEKERTGKAIMIKRWPLGLDASLTPTPAEPRNIAMAKSVDTAAVSGGDEAKQPETANNNLEVTMDENEITALIEKATAKAVQETLKSLPAVNAVEPAQVKSKIEPGYGFKSAGEMFAAAAREVKNGVKDTRLDALKAAGLNESVPSEGGFLVPPEFLPGIEKRMYEIGQILSRVKRIPVSGNGITINAVDESSRATGSRWGGVQGYWLAEAALKTASMPKFRQIELKLKKLAAVAYATDELLSDTTALGSIITDAMQEELQFLAEDAVINGTGAGQPLGIVNSGALVTVAAEAGQAVDTIVSQNIMKMWARMWARSRPNSVWFINQNIEPQLNLLALPVGTGGVPVYMPANGLSAQPFSTLMGRPVIPTEYNSTLGDVGDIILADLSQYVWIDKPTEAATSPHVRFLYDEETFRFVYRCDGQPLWNSALTPFKGTDTQSPYIALAAR